MEMASYHGDVQIKELLTKTFSKKEINITRGGREGNVILFPNINRLVVERKLVASSE
jgi:hypothetical protein